MYSSIIYVSVRIDDREEQGRMTVVRVVCCLLGEGILNTCMLAYDILPKHLGTGGNPDFNHVREGVVLLGFQDKIYNTTITLMNSLYATSFHASVGPRST